MRVALLDARQGDRNPNNSSTVAYRNMLELKNHLNADLYVSAKQLISAPFNYDVIICGFGSTSTEREYSVKFLNNNKEAKLFWMVGEYEQSTFSPLFYSKRRFNVLKNFEHDIKNKKVDNQYFINLNALIAELPSASIQRKYGGLYYGRWRNGRAIYFSRYLKQDSFLSTSPKNMKIFAGNGCTPIYAKALSWNHKKETLKLFSSSLYIEDVFTHTHYNCPANRFYESLKCSVPILIQPESINTFDIYGLKIPEWRVVNNHEDFILKSNELKNDNDFMDFALTEQNEWAKKALFDKDEAIKSIKKCLFDGISVDDGCYA